MTTPSLPELPAPDSHCTFRDDHEYDVFTADQMRAYALSALAADRAATAPDERAAFELWADSAGYTIHRDESAKYKDYHRVTTRFAREGWLSALAWYTRLTAPDRAATDQGKESPVYFPSDTSLVKDAAPPDRAANSLAAPVAWMSEGYPQLVTDEWKRENLNKYPFAKDFTVPLYRHPAAPSVPPVGVGREAEHGSVDSLASSSPPAAALVGQGTGQNEQLMKFYGVSTAQALIDAQTHHIERLQARLPATPSLTPTFLRG